MQRIDVTRREAQEFFDKYIKELDNNKIKEDHLKQLGGKGEYYAKLANENLSLPKELLEDVRFGAE